MHVHELTVRYGGIEAVTQATFTVRAGEVVALLGANGAGKTSLLRTISGLVPAASGTISLRDRRLDGLRPDVITRAGVAHVPEGRRVVAPLDVEENLELAGRAARRRNSTEVAGAVEEVYALFPRLRERRRQASGLLSGGEQQMLAIGRGLMARPDVLILDEPSMGLAPIVIQEIYESLHQRAGVLSETAILLAEQTTSIALSLADRACVLSRGRVVFFGQASEVSEDITVDAYLGSGTSPTTA